MVAQYPYVLQVLSISGARQDADGNFIPQQKNWVNLCRCRDEAGSGKTVTMTSGEAYPYSFLIQMPKGVAAIAAGTQVRVMDGVAVRAAGKVIYSRKDQLHSRTWV